MAKRGGATGGVALLDLQQEQQKISEGLGLDPTKGTVRGRAYDPGFQSSLATIARRLEATGVEAATILNFLPIPLVLNSPMRELQIRIPAAPGVGSEPPFSSHTWRQVCIEVAYRGEQINQPIEYLPIQLAEAYVREFKDYGGVVMVRGELTEETLTRPDVLERIEAARDLMYVWMLKKVEEANGEWNSPNRAGSKNIVALHRECALALKETGLIDSLPDWITPARGLKDVANKCPICQTQPNPGAVECLSCHYVLDPAEAFRKGAITEEDASLERLTREQVEELGVSAYVAETSDERTERLKRGLPKPLSLSQRRVADAQERASRQPQATAAAAI